MKIELDEYDIKSLIAEKYYVETDEITFNIEKKINSYGEDEYTVSVEVLH